ncbi:PsbP domain-containing protein 2, chloroplastic [Vitis vinifera]|uniref:PsbP domain-containing protein 2, chloroplastic n=1 Tax=Vitis vinifera TaxID=29760 RepID=A0A438KK77_VITVI|nr:PsbP domain-containing protein 2, chloroplastic [Vitis vinifera]
MIMSLETVMGLWGACNLLKPSSPPKTLFPIPIPKALKPKTQPKWKPLECCLSKRDLNLSIVSLLLAAALPNTVFKVVAQELEEFQRYTDSVEGFTLLIPSSWIKVDKGGATVLYEEENRGVNNVGVVVSPVRLESLKQFGSPQFVADKVIQAEKRKVTVLWALVGCGICELEVRADLKDFPWSGVKLGKGPI